MHIVTVQVEVADARRPEEMNTLESMGMKIEDLMALAFHSNFGYVKIINVDVHPSHDTSEDTISYSPKTL